MFRLDYNPCEKEYEDWLETLTETQRLALFPLLNDLVYPEQLTKLKRNTKNIEVRVGDVFLVSNHRGVYFYGKVVRQINTRSPKFLGIDKGFVAFIFKETTAVKNLDNYKPDYSNSITGPKIFVDDYWTKGYFEIIDNIPLTKEEIGLDIGFFDFEDNRGGVFVDAKGKIMNHIPQYFNVNGYVTIQGVEIALTTSYIIGLVT